MLVCEPTYTHTVQKCPLCDYSKRKDVPVIIINNTKPILIRV